MSETDDRGAPPDAEAAPSMAHADANDAEAALRLAEAMVFASAEPVSLRALASLLPDEVDAAGTMAALQARYAGRGVELAEVAGGWQFRTAADLAPRLTRLIPRKRRLPRAAMETLAIIAYHQPVTRAEIEEIRGASLSQQTIDMLLEEGLARPAGRREVPGRPTLWATTDGFLARFGLRDLRDLPRREDLLVAPPEMAMSPAAGEPEAEGLEAEGREMADASTVAAPDWSTLPAPVDDGAAGHLVGMLVPSVALPATDGRQVDLAALVGRTVVYAYPRTGRPGVDNPEGWDAIPGARGCSPQSCGFRDHFAELQRLGVTHLFGLATQDTAYQAEAAERLALPFALLSDEGLVLSRALGLPLFETAGMVLLRRLTLVIDDGVVRHVFYPVFPPDRSAADVVAWLRAQGGG